MLLTIALLFVTPEASPMCFASDVRVICCPGACAVKRSVHWTKANEVLRGCMRGIGCEDNTATVGMRCDCQ